MTLLGSKKRMITKDENGENVSRLEIVEATVHCNNNYQQDSTIL